LAVHELEDEGGDDGNDANRDEQAVASPVVMGVVLVVGVRSLHFVH
jgi:hypothetical protein